MLSVNENTKNNLALDCISTVIEPFLQKERAESLLLAPYLFQFNSCFFLFTMD
ncbi:hypothetical protein M472_17350 [Sphingobacterium paucimobilis HER1398]|uniref:Uncharacterized protein n=1 Tax=Sphingobacterium paucimobilis HER1398 TaxID=1346330 RepID=U2J6I2_9SPHI|nr:hypothetical protein M472_17350 [Sphingobacterium paucimobilis HER1398]